MVMRQDLGTGHGAIAIKAELNEAKKLIRQQDAMIANLGRQRKADLEEIAALKQKLGTLGGIE